MLVIMVMFSVEGSVGWAGGSGGRKRGMLFWLSGRAGGPRRKLCR